MHLADIDTDAEHVSELLRLYKPAFMTLTPAFSSSFWDAVAAGSTALADTTRRIYNGNGQTYTFYVLSYFVILYAACGGFR